MGQRWADTNRAMWDERVPIHTRSDFYGVDAFLADDRAVSLQRFEIDEVGDVGGRRLVHPQCHFGKDTLSWARLGARVTGFDFSEPAVEAARDLAARARIDARFVAGDVYDAVDLLDGETFDVVYTGLGAVNWLPDITRWARVMAELTVAGGTFYMAEFHPVHAIFGDDDLVVRHPYFHDPAEPLHWADGGSYADLEAATTHDESYEWTHGLGAVVSSLVDAGLVVEHLHEFDYTLFPRWPFLVQDGDAYLLPGDTPPIPLMYSIRARKPA
jgi:SAM-dependent methyltransferase